MEAELAAAAATTLVGLMASDSWALVKQRLGRFFARGREDDDASVQAELEVSREELMAAQGAGDHLAAADIEASWRVRLRRELQADPAARAQLQRILDEFDPEREAQGSSSVSNTITGSVNHAVVVQGRDNASLTLNQADADRPGPAD
jgi:hypothetical protein